MIRKGRPESIKDVIKGYDKVTKDEAIEKPITIEKVVKGVSEDYGDFIFICGHNEDDKKVFVACPKASFSLFEDCTDSDNEEFARNSYKLVMEKSVSKKGKEYYTCYIDE